MSRRCAIVWALVAVGVLAMPLEALAQPAAPCACEASYSAEDGTCPAGKYAAAIQMQGRWLPADDVTYHIATSDSDMQLPGPAGILSPSEVRGVIVASANAWNNPPCCCTVWSSAGQCTTNPAPSVRSVLRLRNATADVGTVSVPADGKEPESNWCPGGVSDCSQVIKRIWVAKQSYDGVISLPPGVLAVTLPAVADYKIQRSRIAINGKSDGPKWYLTTSTPSGCGGEGCFNLQKTMTHEFGHFIGYLHSACTASVMVPTASPNNASRLQLHETDVKSLCSLVDESDLSGNGYGITAECPPAPSGSTGGGTGGGTSGETAGGAAGRFTHCSTDTDCKAPLVCAQFPTGKHCDIPCTTDDDCPGTEVCPTTGPKFCAVGSVGGASGPPTTDFCAPCDGHSDCVAGVCVQLAENMRICSAYCSSDTSCGSGATCTATTAGGDGVCVPNDTSCVQTATERRGQLNELCDAEHTCGPNLLCVQLAQAAVCLEHCDTDLTKPDARRCSTDGYDCLELDSNLKFGVCFKATAHEGESCLLPDTSLCGFTGKMICAGTPEKQFQDAACYKLCGGQYGAACAKEQTCIGTPIGACQPLPKNPCPLADYGQKCAKGEDCASGMCQIRGTDQACSRTCSVSLQSGCPQAFSCVSAGAGDNGYCWPKSNVVSNAPVCADRAGCGAPASSSTSGTTPRTCGSASEPGGPAVLSALVAAVWLVRRRTRRGPR